MTIRRSIALLVSAAALIGDFYRLAEHTFIADGTSRMRCRDERGKQRLLA